MPRPTIDDPALRSNTHTFSCYDREWTALIDLAKKINLKTPFDVVRLLVQQSNHPVVVATRKLQQFNDPRVPGILPRRRRPAA